MSDPAPVETDKMIGEVLAGRYQIEVRLGEGAMGSVYRARHVKVGRPFAVKVLHKKLLEDRKVAQRFEREAELAGRLRHVNVIGVVDVGETPDGMRYMVMDFAEGDDLATLLTEAPMPAERVIGLTRQMLEGLYHAHEAGLIHRDLKPENVIVERDDHGTEVPRLVDFGIAILREGGDSPNSEGRLTTNGLVLGTPHYMAPEQAVADPIDHRIDLFALGIVIYEMLCGKLPFDGTGAEVARANLLLDPPPIATRVPYLEVDPLLEAFARLLMSKKREARPKTAKVARELLDLITHDRRAAALALGAPMTAARINTPTAPSKALGVPDVVEDTPSNELPVARTDGGLPPEAPAPGVVVPSGQAEVTTEPVRPLARQQGISTETSRPLRYEDEAPGKSRKGLVLGIGGALAIGAVVIVMTLGGGKKAAQVATAKVDEPVVMTPTPPVETPPVPPVETLPAVGSADPGSAVDPGVDPAVGSSDEIAMEPDTVGSGKTPGKRPGKNPRDTSAGSAKVTPEVVKPPPVETPVATAQDARAVSNRYAKVGVRLAQLEKAQGAPAVAEIRKLYRRIQIQTATATDAGRTSANQILDEVERNIRDFK